MEILPGEKGSTEGSLGTVDTIKATSAKTRHDATVLL